MANRDANDRPSEPFTLETSDGDELRVAFATNDGAYVYLELATGDENTITDVQYACLTASEARTLGYALVERAVDVQIAEEAPAMNVHDVTEANIRAGALSHPCPSCGAKAGTRCRFLRPNVTNPKRTTVDVRKNPCEERATLAWRVILAEELTA